MMKAVSTVVATLLMLIITIALAGVTYTYIAGIPTSQTGVLLSVNTNSTCYPTTKAIRVSFDSAGTLPITKNSITVSGTRSDGVPIPGTLCGGTASVSAGTSGACEFTVTGTSGL